MAVGGIAVTVVDSGGMPVTIAGAGGGVPSGTAFPSSPATDDLFYRTDRRVEYFWDGTRWLSTTLYSQTLDGDGSAAIIANTQAVIPHPFFDEYAIYIEKLRIGVYNVTTTAANYFTFQLQTLDGATTASIGTAQSGQGATQNQWVSYTKTINAVVASTIDAIQLSATETGTSQILFAASISYRLVG